MLDLAAVRADPTGERVREALAKRRLAREGGAYVLLLDEQRGDGALAGMPVAVKDLIDVSGALTRCGSPLREGAPTATADAPAVAALRAAGARLVGKTALHQFAFGATGVNEWEGTPRNPHDRSRIPGGSSSGSAVAVAEGSCVAALGTDTGGSVRVPAALCGVFGVKPSYGLISNAGVFPLAPSLDHVGVLAPNVASAREVLAVLAPGVEWTGRAPRRVGIDRRALEESSRAVSRAVEDALRRWDVEMRDVLLPDPDEVMRASTTLLFAEAADVHREAFQRHPEAYLPSVRERLARGLAIPEDEREAARRSARRMRVEVEELLREVDVVVGPTVAFTAPTLAQAMADPEMGSRLVRWTRLWNLVGLPAASVPLRSARLPVGAQIAARADDDALAAAASLEAALAS